MRPSLLAIVSAAALACAGGAAQAQSCGAAMPAFQAAIKANTAEAVAGFIEAHPGCFTGPATAKLNALGGAPETAESAAYDGPPVTLRVTSFFDDLQDAQDRLTDEILPGLGNVSAEVVPVSDWGGSKITLRELPALQEDVVDLALIDTAANGKTFELAYLQSFTIADDADTAMAVADAVRPVVGDILARNDLVPLAFLPGEGRRLFVCNQPIADWSKLRGIKLDIWNAWAEILGARDQGFDDTAKLGSDSGPDCRFARMDQLNALQDIDQGEGFVMPPVVFGPARYILAAPERSLEALPLELREALTSALITDLERPFLMGIPNRYERYADCQSGTAAACPQGIAPGTYSRAGAITLDPELRRQMLRAELDFYDTVADMPKATSAAWRAAFASVPGVLE